MIETIKKEIREHLAGGKYLQAFSRLMEVVSEDSGYFNPLLTRICQSKEVEKQYIGGVLSETEYITQKNKITGSLLSLTTQLQEEDIKPFSYTSGIHTSFPELHLKPIGRLHLVNCDRKPLHDAFSDFFRTHTAVPYQYYFITGCPTQKPGSFAERIIYEIIDDVLLDDEKAIDFERKDIVIGDTTIERVRFRPLPIGMDADKSEKKFKIEFTKRMERFGITAKSVEEFVQVKANQLPFQYSCFVYELEAEEWDAEVSKFVIWLLNLFQSNHTSKPTFLFFFVINMPGAHLGETSFALSEIDKIVNRFSDSCLMMEKPGPVSKQDISTWFRKISNNAHPAKMEAIIEEFSRQMLQKRRWDGKSNMNMMDVEELQETIYYYYLKNKNT